LKFDAPEQTHGNVKTPARASNEYGTKTAGVWQRSFSLKYRRLVAGTMFV
jgi:hypothetical protein